jgi:hypothetical protein
MPTRLRQVLAGLVVAQLGGLRQPLQHLDLRHPRGCMGTRNAAF